MQKKKAKSPHGPPKRIRVNAHPSDPFELELVLPLLEDGVSVLKPTVQVDVAPRRKGGKTRSRFVELSLIDPRLADALEVAQAFFLANPDQRHAYVLRVSALGNTFGEILASRHLRPPFRRPVIVEVGARAGRRTVAGPALLATCLVSDTACTRDCTSRWTTYRWLPWTYCEGECEDEGEECLIWTTIHRALNVRRPDDFGWRSCKCW